MNPALLIKNTGALAKLLQKGVTPPWIVFKNIPDVSIPMDSGFKSENVIFLNCDKNFVYFTLNKSNFPFLRKIYLASHPAEAATLSQFRNTNVKIYIHSAYKLYQPYQMPNACIISHEEFTKITNSLSLFEED